MFKDKINDLIEKQGKPVTKISEEIGIPVTTMYDWMHGRTEPSLRYLKILTKYFDLPPGYFIE